MASGALMIDSDVLQARTDAALSRSRTIKATLSPPPSPYPRRVSSLNKLPKVNLTETGPEQVSGEQDNDNSADDDPLVLGVKSLDVSSTSSGTVSPDNHPTTPPEPVTAVSRVEDEDASFPAFLENMKAHAMFATSTEQFQLIQPEAVIAPPIVPLVPQEAPRSKPFTRRRSWRPPSIHSPDKENGRAAGELDRSALGLAQLQEAASPTADSKTKSKRRNSWMTPSFDSSKLQQILPQRDGKEKRPISAIFTSQTASTSVQPQLPLIHETEPSPKSVEPVDEALAALNRTSISNADRLSSLPPLNTNLPFKKSKRPLSGLFSATGASPTTPKRSQDEPRSAPPVSIAKSFSMDRLPALKDSLPSLDRFSTLSKASLDKSRTSSERSSSRTDTNRKRDESWGSFKALDADYQKCVATAD